nr:ABC transporter permease subunit [Vibrio gallicus]
MYFILETIPVFSSPSHHSIQLELPIDSAMIMDATIDSTGHNIVLITKSGKITYYSINKGQAELVNQAQLKHEPLFVSQSGMQSWVATMDSSGAIEVVMPEFIVSHSETGRNYTPNLRVDNTLPQLSFGDDHFATNNFVFAKQGDNSVFVRADSKQVEILSYWSDAKGAVHRQQHTLRNHFNNINQIQISKDGRFLAVLDDNAFHLFNREKVGAPFVPRIAHASLAVDDLSKTFKLLNGERSVITSDTTNKVELWFMVVNRGRQFIRGQNYQLASPLTHILAQHTVKGFWTIEADGEYTLFNATNSKPIMRFKSALLSPAISVLSENDEFILNIAGKQASITRVEAPHQQISLKALTQKIKYEGYPSADYVWQPAAATEDIEPKFSLTPLVFGTLKAATYAMLFSVPIAVFGAIYTAFFMSSPVRNVVKPTIELMEALPTLVIGFVAATWFAPFLEKNLLGFILSVITMPVVTLLLGRIWLWVPVGYSRRVPRGLHLLSLLPVLLIVIVGTFFIAPYLESLWFSDGLILYLADHGWDYQQRNSLIVGLAMGFAVIPTIFTIAEDAISSVPKHLSDGSLALGATEWQTLTRVVLLTASPGIISAVMLGMGRAVGETMIVLTVTGNTPLTEWNIFDGLRSLTATIATELPESKVGSSHYHLLFLSALILFLFTFVVNSVAESVRQRLRDKYRSL